MCQGFNHFSCFLLHFVLAKLVTSFMRVTLSNVDISFAINTRMQRFGKSSKPCHIGIRWISLAKYSQMSTHVPGFKSSSCFLHTFVLAKLATSSIRVKNQELLFLT